MGSRSGEKIKIISFDDLFGTEVKAEPEENQVVRIALSELHPFKNHPFRVLDNGEMAEMAASVREYGILVPVIVRKDENGGYEIVAGHRRKRASELAGLVDIPAIIRKMTDDEAVIVMVDSNIQRQDILPSEKAKAYRMKMEAMNHQGVKAERHTAALVGEAAGDSERTVHRYVRLSYLKPALLEYVDQRQISIVTGENLSYLREEEQEKLLSFIAEKRIFPTKNEAEQLRLESSQGVISEELIKAVLARNVKRSGVTISAKRLQDYFPKEFTTNQIENVIYSLLAKWKEEERK